MKYYRTSLLVLTAIALLAACCSAAVVTVKDSTPNGWAWTSNKGILFFSGGGPCIDEDAGFRLGSGALYAECGYNAGTGTLTPSTNWIGTDIHAGQPLSGVLLTQIKELTYSTYVTKRWTMQGGSGEWKWPRMPFQLQITIRNEAGSRRQLWHRPWYTEKDGARGSNYSSDHLGKWEDWDAINGAFPGNQWYEAQTNWTGVWSTGDPLNPGIIEKYPGWYLVETSTELPLRSAGWDGSTDPIGAATSTATGMPLNFSVGARKGSTNIFGGTAPAWSTESIGFKGYVDNFTLGVDFDSSGTLEPSEVVTYDFETDRPAPLVVCTNGKALNNAPGNPKHLFRHKLFGIVLASYDGYVGSTPIPDPTPTEFWIWDGSMKSSTSGMIKSCWQVICLDNTEDIWPGQYVSVIGRTEPRFYFKNDPSAFWTNANDVHVLQDIGTP